MKHAVTLILAAMAVVGAATPAGAHCQLPCGIYDDELRAKMIEEDITTVEKSMDMITSLSAADRTPLNQNQLVRWVISKEDHAQKIQDVVTGYFMAQRVKPAPSSDAPPRDLYLKRLELLHRIQVEAMKAKQTVDLEHVEEMRRLVKAFRKAYFGEADGHSQ